MKKLSTHGTRNRYAQGCKCARCKKANSEYVWARFKAVRSGDFRPGTVSPARAKRHLLVLQRARIGSPAVARASGLFVKDIQEIRRGGRQFIWEKTEARILAVTKLDSAYVSARPTVRKISTLMAMGFTRSELARRLGHPGSAPGNASFRRARVQVRTADKVAAIYRELHG